MFLLGPECSIKVINLFFKYNFSSYLYPVKEKKEAELLHSFIHSFINYCHIMGIKHIRMCHSRKLITILLRNKIEVKNKKRKKKRCIRLH